MNSNFSIGGGTLSEPLKSQKTVTAEEGAKNAAASSRQLESENAVEPTKIDAYPWMKGYARNYKNSIYYKDYVKEQKSWLRSWQTNQLKLNPIPCNQVDEPPSTTLCQLSAILRKMPKTKAELQVPKRPKPSAFMEYVMEFRYRNPRYRRYRLSALVEEAGKSWSQMSHEQRAPFVEKAKTFETKSMQDRGRCNNHGQPLWAIETVAREQQLNSYYVRRAIEDDVKQAADQSKLAEHTVFFIKFNYFAMVTNDVGEDIYMPAEVALCEFSLQTGIVRKHHMLINPGGHIYGMAYLAGAHSATTHQLPPPPNALGHSNLTKIYNTLLTFIGRNSCEPDQTLSTVYTDVMDIEMVKSCLKYLNRDGADTYLRVFPVQFLFYQMKVASVRLAGRNDSPSIFMTDLHFERDYFEYTNNIGCEFHEKVDRSRYCAKSYITRWCYTISENICKDLNIKLIPDRHGPTSLNKSIRPDYLENPNYKIHSTTVTATGTDNNKNVNILDSYSSKHKCGDRPPWMNGFGRRWNTPLKDIPELREHLSK